jgi:prepilin-type N-terminal cleavage/methylation domain-containing protein
MAAKAAQALQRMCPISSVDAQRGFTLIETMAVMMIIALVASIAVTMTKGTGRGELKALALETADLLRRERLGATLTGRQRQVFIDGDGRALLGEGRETFSLFDRTREKQARVPGPSTRPRHQTAPNTGYLYEGRVAPARPTQPAKDEPEL